jgi:glycosyltransferase involved in cell wall biosynthesis
MPHAGQAPLQSLKYLSAEAAALLVSWLDSQSATLALFTSHGLSHYLRSHYTDTTFQHLYQWNWFDATLLIPYFVVMVILALYGVHRYQLVWLYYRHRKKATREPAQYFQELPFITIQLPIFNEQYVIDRLIEACCRLEYPQDRLQIQLLDDSTDETREVAAAIVEKYRAAGHPIEYIHRTNRHGYKAGALDHGLQTAKGEFVAIFDADFVPPPQWLMQVVHHFAEPGVGMVQTRWTHLNRDYSFLTQVEAILLDGHFVLEHGGRSRAGVFFNFNGTAGMWRRVAIAEAGGWQHDTLTEDTDLSYRAQLKGWQFKYLPHVECPAELPIEMTAFKTQQARWAKGLIQTSKKVLPMVWRSKMPLHTKIEAVYHLTANLSAADACDDYPLLPGLDPDAVDRLSADDDVDIFYLVVLSGFAEGIVSKNMVEDCYLSSVFDGAGDWADRDQYACCTRSIVRNTKRVQADAEVSRGETRRDIEGSVQVSQAARVCAVDRVADWLLLCVDDLVCDCE